MVGERLLVGWGLAEKPVMLPVISAPELELGKGLSPYDENHRILSAAGLIVALRRHAASR